MTEDIKDFNWDDGDVIDKPMSEGRHLFGRLQLIVKNVQKSWQPGSGFTVDGIPASEFDYANDKVVDGLKKFGGYDLVEKSSLKLMILVAELKNKDGETYQQVKSYPNQVSKKSDYHYWKELVFPALKEIPENKRSLLQASGIWAEWDELPTGQTYNENEIKYWGNIKVHDSEASLRKTEAEFFGQFSGEQQQVVGNRPAEWATVTEAEFNEFIQGLWNEGKSLAEIAEVGGFAGQTANGQEVDLKQLFKDALSLDMPTPMVKMEMVKDQ